jgi:hypothetical protein
MPLVPEQRSRGTLPSFTPESSSFSSPVRNKPTYFASSVILLESVGSWGKMITLRCVSLDFCHQACLLLESLYLSCISGLLAWCEKGVADGPGENLAWLVRCQ